jgi:hypothetical protein
LAQDLKLEKKTIVSLIISNKKINIEKSLKELEKFLLVQQELKK